MSQFLLPALRALLAFGCFSLGSAGDGKIVNAKDSSETGGSSPSVFIFQKTPEHLHTLDGWFELF